ncbi:ATP-binding protein [Actinomadura sp. HBU206391]|uniref:ATP-binding protein n=1 Tax=Actinomadura sp. HBU206391 TaxID=2731692 RepID=UPI00164EEFE4|nr:ATP-binding protein [Actinomadura sp. HBU206391]MBC6460794.1 ATP-binding protein [Actinomadura sp. HBU206391]
MQEPGDRTHLPEPSADPPERSGELPGRSRDDPDVPEIAVLVGLQGSGKTTFFRDRLAGTHVHVSKDNLGKRRRRQARQMRMIDEALAAGRNVAVDNTNPSREEWDPLIEMARTHGAKVTGYWFPPDVPGSLRRNAARTPRTRVPDVGIYATVSRLRRPLRSDGFDELRTVRFDGTGGFDVTAMDESGDPPDDAGR